MTIIFLLIFISTLFLNQVFMIMCSNLLINDPITLFSFPSFSPNSCNGDLLCMGSVSVGNSTNSGHYLNLTPEPPNSSSTPLVEPNAIGRVLYGKPVLAWPAMISTTFTVRISPFPNSSGSGDGMAFVIAQDNSPSPPGSFGSYLGLLDRSTQGALFNFPCFSLCLFMWLL